MIRITLLVLIINYNAILYLWNDDNLKKGQKVK